MQALACSPHAVRRFIHAEGMRYLLSPHWPAVRKHRGNKLTTAERAFPSGRANRTLDRNENLAGIYAARQGTTCAAAVDPSCGLSYVLSAERRVANPACAKAWAFLLQFLGAAEQKNLPRWDRGKYIRRAGENITKTVWNQNLFTCRKSGKGKKPQSLKGTAICASTASGTGKRWRQRPSTTSSTWTHRPSWL